MNRYAIPRGQFWDVYTEDGKLFATGVDHSVAKRFLIEKNIRQEKIAHTVLAVAVLVLWGAVWYIGGLYF
jgi:hypothetical protein